MYRKFKNIFSRRQKIITLDNIEISDERSYEVQDEKNCNINIDESMAVQVGKHIRTDTLPASIPVIPESRMLRRIENSCFNTTNTHNKCPPDQVVLEEITEFYHKFPDIHTEVRVILANNVTVYLLGTNHADPQCPIDVVNIMKRVNPQATLIELCAWRACACKRHRGNIFQLRPQFTFSYLRRVIRQIGFLPAMIFFTDAFNEHTAVERQLLDYGGEFAVAAQSCAESGNCKIVLSDREIPITVRRQASSMGNWRGLKITYYVTMSLIRKSKLKKYLVRGHKLVIRDPSFYQIVVLERDIFLTYMIQAAANLPYREKGPQIIAVVGQGHLNGIQTFWGKVVPQVLPLILDHDSS